VHWLKFNVQLALHPRVPPASLQKSSQVQVVSSKQTRLSALNTGPDGSQSSSPSMTPLPQSAAPADGDGDGFGLPPLALVLGVAPPLALPLGVAAPLALPVGVAPALGVAEAAGAVVATAGDEVCAGVGDLVAMPPPPLSLLSFSLKFPSPQPAARTPQASRKTPMRITERIMALP